MLVVVLPMYEYLPEYPEYLYSVRHIILQDLQVVLCLIEQLPPVIVLLMVTASLR